MRRERAPVPVGIWSTNFCLIRPIKILGFLPRLQRARAANTSTQRPCFNSHPDYLPCPSGRGLGRGSSSSRRRAVGTSE